MPKDSEIVISTGPIPGSKKVYVNAGKDGALRVPFREVKLEDSANEPPVRLYDTSGPYTADDVTIDVTAGIERIRESWISARGDVEEYEGREIKVEDNNRKEGDKDACPEFPAKHRPLRARDGAVVTQMAYARRGIITPEMEFVAARENLGRSEHAATAKPSARISPTSSRRNSSAMKSPPAGRSSRTTSTTRNRNRWSSAGTSW